MAVSISGGSPSRYAQIFGAEAGIDPYTRAVSDVYQDLFGEGSFIGKGIYDVDAFEGSLKGRFPENRILSHDLLEGCYAHSGLLSDVELYEASVALRRRRGAKAPLIRGDWQIARWLLPRVPSRAAAASGTRCRCSRSGRSSTTCGAARAARAGALSSRDGARRCSPWS
jgi:hypothetical protein